VTKTALILLVWAGLLAVNTSVMPIFHATPVSIALLGGASVATAVTAALVFGGRRRAPESDPDAERPVTDLSVASGWTGLGIALLALSPRFGIFLALIAGGMVAFGIGGIVRELRAESHARRVRR
jgi:hypothetical protein